jgi:hypothetical protein
MRALRIFWNTLPTILLISVLLAALWSCDLEARTSVRSGDIADLAGGVVDEVLLHASLLFPRPSDDIKAELLDFLSRRFRKFGNVRQVDRGLNSFLSADVVFPMRRPGSRSDPAKDELLAFYASEDGDAKVLALRINEGRLKEISRFVNDKTLQEIGLKDLAVILEFSNDSSVELEFQAGHCFIDGEPILAPAAFSLASEGTSEIRLADVLRDYIAMKDGAEILRFHR